MADIAHLTTDAFETAIESETPVLVDFWAEWCAPCRAISPILDEIARDNAGRVSVVKLNVDEEPEVPKRLGIMGIPTVILFANGEEKVRIVGARGKDQFLKEIEPHLA